MTDGCPRLNICTMCYQSTPIAVKTQRGFVCMVITYSKSKDQPGMVANPARGQLNPSRVSLLTYGIPPDFRGGVHLFI